MLSFPVENFISFFVIFLSALLQAATGFGFAIIAIPIMVLFLDPHEVIPLVMCTSFITLSLNMKTVWKDSDKVLLKRLLIGSLLGLPIGGWLFATVDDRMMKVLVSVGILFSTLLLFMQKVLRPWMEKWTRYDWMFGMLSGSMTTSVGMPGPAIMLILSARQEKQGAFRATGINYLFFIYPVSMLILAYNGALTVEILLSVLFFVPFAFLGMMVGNKVHGWMSPRVFNILIYVLLLATGMYSFVKNV